MPDEVSRALGMEGGGFSVYVPTLVLDADGKPIPVLDSEQKPVLKDGEPVYETKDVEWILSDLSKTLQSRHVAWIKGRRRRDKQLQLEEGIINGMEYKQELAFLDDLFSMNEYSFGKPHWQACVSTGEGAAKLYQLLLEQNHPHTKEWELEQVQELVGQNPEGFTAALSDILPKAMGKGTAKKSANATPSSR